jgi:hypothetical protein
MKTLTPMQYSEILTALSVHPDLFGVPMEPCGLLDLANSNRAPDRHVWSLEWITSAAEPPFVRFDATTLCLVVAHCRGEEILVEKPEDIDVALEMFKAKRSQP